MCYTTSRRLQRTGSVQVDTTVNTGMYVQVAAKDPLKSGLTPLYFFHYLSDPKTTAEKTKPVLSGSARQLDEDYKHYEDYQHY